MSGTWEEAIMLDPRVEAFRDDPKAGAVICALHGHSVVDQGCFGYWHCTRCEAQVGDSLASTYNPRVALDHDCPVCREGWAKATFWERFGCEPDGTGFLQVEGS